MNYSGDNQNPNQNPSPFENQTQNQTENREGTSGTRFCPRCGKALPINAAFCGECGMNLTTGTVTYQPPQPNVVYEDTTPLKMWEYFLLIFLTGIPIVGLILCLVWGLGGETNVNRRNFCRAMLIMYLISAILTAIFLVLYIGIIVALLETSELSAFAMYASSCLH